MLGVLERHVALHVIAADDPRAELLLDAARRSATVLDPRILRVLDAERTRDFCYVVNEWGSGTSLDIMLASNGPLSPRRGAWMVSEVSDSIAAAHAHGVAHGLLSPENVLLDNAGSVRIIGFCVDAALHAITLGAAYTLHMDHLVGSIEVGKHADFCVLRDDPAAVAPKDLKDLEVLGTVIGGHPLPLREA